jgi:hypothetical protein
MHNIVSVRACVRACNDDVDDDDDTRVHIMQSVSSMYDIMLQENDKQMLPLWNSPYSFCCQRNISVD